MFTIIPRLTTVYLNLNFSSRYSKIYLIIESNPMFLGDNLISY